MIQWLFDHIKRKIQNKYHKTFILINDIFESQKNEELVVPVEESRIIVWTSLGFCVPACYALYKEQYSYAYLSMVTSGISMLYWWYPSHGWRRNLDLCFAKVSFFTYFITAYMQMKKDVHPKYSMMIYTGTPLMLLLYNLSCMDKKNWWLYHSGFHIVINMHKMVIIYFMN